MREHAIDANANGNRLELDTWGMRLSITEIDAERLARGQSDTAFRELLIHYPTAVRNTALVQ